MPRPENPKWNLDEITEAFEGSILPEDVAAIMTRFAERKQVEDQESERMQRASLIIEEYDNAIRSDREGGITKPDYVMDAASAYLSSQSDKGVIDELDRNLRLASLYTLAAFELPYNNYEDTSFSRYLPKHPIDESEIRQMLRTYVVEIFGEDVWPDERAEQNLDDLYDKMLYFDGEPIGEVLSRQHIFINIKQELARQGFSVNAIEEGEE
ncbi:MAG: hypothetical protein JWN75_970 [Candidatus Saccharibacteria bacterium]|nr:hypothetical protein [Candidatus Saccharibacteria bacterium]